MDPDLYDEFGNYIGPSLQSDSEDEEEFEDQDNEVSEFFTLNVYQHSECKQLEKLNKIFYISG